jgi:hypothetical protein
MSTFNTLVRIPGALTTADCTLSTSAASRRVEVAELSSWFQCPEVLDSTVSNISYIDTRNKIRHTKNCHLLTANTVAADNKFRATYRFLALTIGSLSLWVDIMLKSPKVDQPKGHPITESSPWVFADPAAKTALMRFAKLVTEMILEWIWPNCYSIFQIGLCLASSFQSAYCTSNINN